MGSKSLDPQPTPDVKTVWCEEIERRVREIEDGTVELLDWQDVRGELFGDE
jgi:hypothetical protein